MNTGRTIAINALCAAVIGALSGTAALAASDPQRPSSVSESAPARTGPASVPSEPAAGGKPAYPRAKPSGVSESAPATTGPASTPTHGQGRSAPAAKTEAVNRLPQTPSSVSESAPARTGSATVPTARAPQSFEAADLNKDGVIDRREYERLFPAQGATR